MGWFKKRTAEAAPLSHREGAARLTEILAPGAVKIGLEATDKEEAIEELVDLLVRSGGVDDREAALQAIHAREALGSTGIGNGIAIPHGKHEKVPRLVGALGISSQGVEFGGMDGKPAHIIFMLLARADNPGPHIQALAAIAQLIQSPDVVRRLLSAKTPAEALEVVRSEE